MASGRNDLLLLRSLIGVVLLIGLGIGGWLLFAGTDDDGDGSSVLEYAEVAVTDLTEVSTFDGTLGFDEGDPITTARGGTLTGAARAGATLSEGDVVYEVDDAPLILLYGRAPLWRDIGLIPRLESLTPRAAGTLTWMAAEGDVIEQGDVLMRIDDRPVIVLYGDVPAYRTLRRTVAGTDVVQLKSGLTALGFDPNGTLDLDNDEFTAALEAVVVDWQQEAGVDDDGTVDLGQIVSVPGPLTIDTVLVAVGSPVGGAPVARVFFETEGSEGDDVLALQEALLRLGHTAGDALVASGVFDDATLAALLELQDAAGMEADGTVGPPDVLFKPGAVRVADRFLEPGALLTPGMAVLGTSTGESVVTIDLPAADQALLDEGERVVVVLPDDTRIDGTVQSKAETATVSPQGEATFKVVIVLDDTAAAAGLDQAPVGVEVITDRADDVLAVPVTALLALAESGYAVEVEQPDGSTRLVAVDAGMYADGLVEVTSTALSPGDRVVAP
ncbi:MAG: peptidoglycan-binding protein [Acidimicrobiia bacterium]|nr:peptidoglycan-binding protein [Acidimicrobiia bacterium]